MTNKLNIYILGDFKSGTASGLAEFNYQNALLLKDTFCFNFIEFDTKESKKYYELEYREEIPIHRFGSKGLAPLQLSSLFRLWLKDIPKIRVVFHLNHIYNVENYLVAKILYKMNIPYLITPHDSYVYCSEYKKDKPFVKRLYRDLFVKIFDKYVLDHARVIHALTIQCISCLNLLSRSPVIIVANQIRDMNLLLNLSIIRPQVCYIGRFDIFQKGIDLALNGFQLFKEASSNHENIVFTLIGPADTAELTSSKNICRNLKLREGKDVVFTGEITESERNRILAQSKVYMQLSRFEGFGLSIVQALSSYKPVIVSRKIPFSDIITAYNAGFVVSNPEETARALANIFNMSSSEYIAMAENARLCYEREFHPEVIKPQLINLYNQAAGE